MLVHIKGILLSANINNIYTVSALTEDDHNSKPADNWQYALYNHLCFFGCFPVLADSPMASFLGTDFMAGFPSSYPTDGIKARKGTQSNDPSLVEIIHWLHPFFIHQWCPDKRCTVPFTLAI